MSRIYDDDKLLYFWSPSKHCRWTNWCMLYDNNCDKLRVIWMILCNVLPSDPIDYIIWLMHSNFDHIKNQLEWMDYWICHPEQQLMNPLMALNEEMITGFNKKNIDQIALITNPIIINGDMPMDRKESFLLGIIVDNTSACVELIIDENRFPFEFTKKYQINLVCDGQNDICYFCPTLPLLSMGSIIWHKNKIITDIPIIIKLVYVTSLIYGPPYKPYGDYHRGYYSNGGFTGTIT